MEKFKFKLLLCYVPERELTAKIVVGQNNTKIFLFFSYLGNVLLWHGTDCGLQTTFFTYFVVLSVEFIGGTAVFDYFCH